MASTRIAGGALLALLAPWTAMACATTDLARLPLTEYRGLPVVEVEVNGHAMAMILDTGAQATTVTPEAAGDARLVPDRRFATRMQGISGPGAATWNYDAAAVPVSVGDLAMGSVRLRVAAVMGRGGAVGIAGVLGADILSRHDLELDVAHARATIHDVRGCVGDFVPWTAIHDRVGNAWANAAQTQLTIPSSIGDTPVRSFVDTGAAGSMVTRRAATAAGIDDAAMTAAPGVTGVDALGAPIPAKSFAFPRFQVGNETFRGVSVLVCDCEIPNADLQLGEDYLSSRKVWLSYMTGQVFITRAGR